MSTFVGNQPRFMNSPIYQNSGDGTTVNYTLTWIPGNVNSLLVALSGVVQTPGTDFTVLGSTLTFTTAPRNGLPFFVVGMGVQGMLGVPADNTVTTTKLADSAVTYTKLSLPWSVKITTYTAVAGDKLMCNTTTAGFQVTLPVGVANAEIVISDYAGKFAINNLTVTPNGAEKIMGVAESFICNNNNETRTFVYIDATQGWRVL